MNSSGDGARVLRFGAPGPDARFEEALLVERLADAIDVLLQLEEIELVARVDLDLGAHRRGDRRIDAAEGDRADDRPDAPLGRRLAVAAAERDLVADAEADRAAVARQRAQLDVAAREIADDERRLAVLAQVLRDRELDLIAQPLADRQSGRRVGAVVADQRRVFLVVAEVAIEKSPRSTRNASRPIARPVTPSRSADSSVNAVSVLVEPTRLGGDLAGRPRSVLGGQIDRRPLERAGQRHGDVAVAAADVRFGGDVELRDECGGDR